MGEYQVHLAQFEGPLDLLLHLVNKAQIDLKDIFVSEITQQYLDLMEQLSEIDMDRASEFVRTASVLLYIKSRSLLPEPPPAMPEEEEDPEAVLLEQLRTYRMYKEAARILKQREDCGNSLFVKPPEELVNEEAPVDIRGDARMLQEAFLKLLAEKRHSKPKEPTQVQIHLEAWTIPAQKTLLLRTLREKGSSSFDALFSDAATVEEIVVTFAALLELWNAGELKVRQSAPFAEILIDYVDTESLRTSA